MQDITVSPFSNCGVVKPRTTNVPNDAALLSTILEEAKPAGTPLSQLGPEDFVKHREPNGNIVVRPGVPIMGVSTEFIYKPDGSVVKKTQLILPGRKPTAELFLPPGSIDPALLDQ